MLPDVHEVELDNGFRALLVARGSLPVVASTLWYQVGSRDERTGETGLSHFLEHMMFKGTERYAKGEIDLLTSKMGGSNNAFTSHDVTSYYFALASDRWETALEIEASRMTGCTLDHAEFEAEKSVVLEELAMGEDDPWHALYQTMEGMAYQVHPYHHPVIGWRQDLERLEVDTMRSYYRRHYGPNRSFLVAVGDLDVHRTEERVRELFGPLPAAEARPPVLGEPRRPGERRATQSHPGAGDIARGAYSYPTCRMGEPDDFVLDIVSHVLGGSKTSRLFKRLVLEEQIATNVWVINEVRLDPGLFTIGFELRPGREPAEAEAVLEEEIDLLARRGATAKELSRVRTQLRSSYLFEEETVLDVAMRLGRFEATTDQGYRLLADVLPRYAAVTSADVKRVVRAYLSPQSRHVVWVVPDESKKAARNGRARSRR